MILTILKAKLFESLKIPKAYLGYEEQISGKATFAFRRCKISQEPLREYKELLYLN